MITLTCTQCGLQMIVPLSVQGSRGVCFGCGADLIVPFQTVGWQEGELVYAPGVRMSDRYEIQEQIGQGGQGAVYRAWDSLIGEFVALKFIKPQLLQTQRGQRMFIREAQIARRLRHDHIVAVHDVGRTPEGILYLSMECIRGHSLRLLLAERRKTLNLVSVRVAVRIIEQVLEALHYAHRSVVHRDIKPENIMVLPGEKVIVLDFGLARAIDIEASESGTLTTVSLIGTKAYAAPEQRKTAEIDLRTDIYSTGLVFHELLTLRTPVDKPVRVQDIRQDVSPSILETLARALQEDRANRWQSAAEFRETLLEAYRASYERPATQPALEMETEHNVASTDGMVFLPGGSFLMGSNDDPEEYPEFEANVDPFYIDMYPVTMRQYNEFIKASGRPKPRYWNDARFGGAEQPVIGVSWEDAQAYAQWVGKQLPTEMQWEFAARGQANRKYPWGSSEPDPTRANYADNLGMTSIVGMHEDGVTPDGIHDLAGNVYEWTQDWFLPYPAQGDLQNARETPRRSARGGSWKTGPRTLQCTHRIGLFPETQDNTVGFRCVLAVRGNT